LKNSSNRYFSIFFILCIIFIHFDPTGIKITIGIFFLLSFLFTFFKFKFYSYTPYILLIISLIFPFINLFLNKELNVTSIDFLKYYILYALSAIIHILINYLPIKKNSFNFANILKPSFILILFIVSIQFFSSFLLHKPLLFNLFGKYQYSNLTSVDVLTANFFPRTQGFYLEPSYLAFVTITLICISINTKKFIKFSFVIGALIIMMSGSRGGLLGLFLILISYLFLNFKFNSFKSYSYFSLLLLFGFFLVIPVLSILTLESLNTVNSSQYVRFYQGFNLSIYVLSNYLLGIPLGTLENAYQISSGESSAIFSFFIFNVIFHGWLSFLFLIFLFIKLIFSKIHINTRIYFLIYLLLYFNMTGIIISPDTYFWFFCFYYTYRISKGKIHKQIDESIYI
jgi:hypothetical protein